MKPWTCWLSGGVLALAACTSAVPPAPPAPTVDPAQAVLFHNGRVITLEAGQPAAVALLVRGDRIEAVGTDADLLARREPGMNVLDLRGRTLMPGFVDAHTHVLNDARSLGWSLDQAQAQALQAGITTLGDLYVDPAFLREIQAFAQAGQLRVRTSLYLVHNDPCGRLWGDWWKAYPPTRVPGEMLRIGGVKIFTDGGACGGVALSFEREGVEGHGDLWMSQAELNRVVAAVQAAGHQAALHAIGDRAVAQALAAVDSALAGRPNLQRHRLEHVSVIAPEQVARFGQLGVVPVLPGQYPSCTPFGPPLPEAYGAWEWPWRDLRVRNPALPIAWHSDYPYWSINPFIHLYGFVTRKDVYNGYSICQPPVWLRDDTLPVEAALEIMTLGSAYALFREDEVGSLKPGKYADLIVVTGDPLTVPAEDLRRLSVLLTMVGGRTEYCAGAARDLCPGYTARPPAPRPDFRPPGPVRWLTLFLVAAAPVGAGVLRLSRRTLAGRLGGLAGMAGGALWLLGGWLVTGDWSESPWVFVSIIAAGALALGVVGLASVSRPGWAVRIGLIPAGTGAAALGLAIVLSAWFEWEAGWLLLMAGLLSHTLGLTLFGLANLKQRLWPRWPAGPLLVGALGGPVPVLASILAGDNAGWPVGLMVAALGLGWLALGFNVWASARPGLVAAPA